MKRSWIAFWTPMTPRLLPRRGVRGLPDNWIEGAQRSPVYKMAKEWKVAFPLHPEYRTLPMVWYVPPLSPIQSAADAGKIGKNGIFP
jgi:nitrate reductase / nitrite oxidoreductase, beta subunit